MTFTIYMFGALYLTRGKLAPMVGYLQVKPFVGGSNPLNYKIKAHFLALTIAPTRWPPKPHVDQAEMTQNIGKYRRFITISSIYGEISTIFGDISRKITWSIFLHPISFPEVLIHDISPIYSEIFIHALYKQLVIFFSKAPPPKGSLYEFLQALI